MALGANNSARAIMTFALGCMLRIQVQCCNLL